MITFCTCDGIDRSGENGWVKGDDYFVEKLMYLMCEIHGKNDLKPSAAFKYDVSAWYGSTGTV